MAQKQTCRHCFDAPALESRSPSSLRVLASSLHVWTALCVCWLPVCMCCHSLRVSRNCKDQSGRTHPRGNCCLVVCTVRMSTTSNKSQPRNVRDDRRAESATARTLTNRNRKTWKQNVEIKWTWILFISAENPAPRVPTNSDRIKMEGSDVFMRRPSNRNRRST